MEQEKNKVNTYNYIYESCSICGRKMYKTSQIWVDKNDNYICKKCKDFNDINAVPCMDLNFSI